MNCNKNIIFRDKYVFMYHLDYSINKSEQVVEIYRDEINEPIEVDFAIMYMWADKNGLTSNVRTFLKTNEKQKMTISEYFSLPYDTLKEDIQRYYLEKILK